MTIQDDRACKTVLDQAEQHVAGIQFQRFRLDCNRARKIHEGARIAKPDQRRNGDFGLPRRPQSDLVGLDRIGAEWKMWAVFFDCADRYEHNGLGFHNGFFDFRPGHTLDLYFSIQYHHHLQIQRLLDRFIWSKEARA
jgi:hypothetical protein